jgi:hypothetical protein
LPKSRWRLPNAHRTAMITTTALVDAGRQIAAWLDRTLRDNDQADADVQYIQSIAAPETQLAVAVTQRENQHATSSTNTSNDLNTDFDTSGANIQSTSAAIEKSSAVDSATAWKAYQVALASLDEGAATTAVDKAYQDALAHVTRNSRVAYANLTYTEGVVQVGSVADAITDMGQAGKTYVTNLAGDEQIYTDTAAPIIGARTLLYTEADIDLRKAITTADNVWRNNTAQAWGTHTAGDLAARGTVRRSLAYTSNLLADASNASVAELKAQWWQNEIPNYLQWSVDIGGIETTFTNRTTANILLRTTGVKNAGIAYASTVGTAIKAHETTTATARELYLSTLMTISETAAEATMRADRDKEIALANADLQKQLTGNESAHTTAVNNANSAHSTATGNAEAARKSAEQAALTQLNSTLAQATKDKEASIAGAERLYDQAVASLDAQYGSESSNGDTGVEGATRRSAIKTRDAQYYAARDTSWANTLSASINLGTTPWTVKAITAANAQAAHSVSRASAQAAHDAAMLDAMEDWQLSRNESLTDLLFTEGQSRETYNVATSNVYANWENGVGNLLGDKPEGTGYVPVRGFGEGGVGTWGSARGGNFNSFDDEEEFDDEDSDFPADELPDPSEQSWAQWGRGLFFGTEFDEQEFENVVKFLRPDVWEFWKEQGGVLNKGDYWWDGSLNWDFDGKLHAYVEEDLNAIDAAKLFIERIENSFATGTMFAVRDGGTPESIAKAERQWYKRAAEAAEIGVDTYLTFLSVANEGADWVVVVDELHKGNYQASLAFLPFVTAGSVKVVSKSGELIDEFVPKKSRWYSIKKWHDDRVFELFGNLNGAKFTSSRGRRTYDANYNGLDIEFKSDNFSTRPRSDQEIERMRKQIEKDIELKTRGANPHWHFDHDPSNVAEMQPLLKLLADNGINWTWGKNLPK